MAKKKGGKSKLKNIRIPKFWSIIGIIFVLSIITIVLQSGKDIQPTGHATQTIAFMKAGSELSFEIRDVSGLASGKVIILEDIKNAKIITNELVPEANELKRVEISSIDEDKIESIELSWKIENLLIRNKNDIKVFQNDQLIDTKLEKVEERYTYYKTTSSELGIFYIKEVTEEEPTTIDVVQQQEIIEQEIEAELPPQLEEKRAIVGKATEESKQKEEHFLEWFVDLFKLK